MEALMCRKGAWRELTAEVTSIVCYSKRDTRFFYALDLCEKYNYYVQLKLQNWTYQSRQLINIHTFIYLRTYL